MVQLVCFAILAHHFIVISNLKLLTRLLKLYFSSRWVRSSFLSMIILLSDTISIWRFYKCLKQVMSCHQWIYIAWNCDAFTEKCLEKPDCNWNFCIDFFLITVMLLTVLTTYVQACIRLVAAVYKMWCISRKVLSRSCPMVQASPFPLKKP